MRLLLCKHSFHLVYKDHVYRDCVLYVWGFFFFVLSSSLFLWNTWQNVRLKSTAPICAIKVRHVGAEKQLRIW